MKVLVLGYSVTAEKLSFVEVAAETAQSAVTFAKVGYGGLQPHHARYLFPKIVAREAPDMIILDQATPAFRKHTGNVEEYSKCLLNVVRLCQSQGILMGILDLPRTDVDYTDDWVTNLHREVAGQAGIARLCVPMDPEYVWDEVHPTDAGRAAYATALLTLVEQTETVPAYPQDALDAVPDYDSVPIDSMVPASHERRDMARGGDSTVMVLLQADAEIRIDFERPCRVRACSYLMGPRTGYLEFAMDGFEQKALAYDAFCYYERLGVVSFNMGGTPQGVEAGWISVKQLPDLPDVPLRKGTPNTDPRVGAIGHIFIENTQEEGGST